MATKQTSSEADHPSRALIVLVVLWLALALRLVVALVRRETMTDGLALLAIALFMSTAILGSRVYGSFVAPTPT